MSVKTPARARRVAHTSDSTQAFSPAEGAVAQVAAPSAVADLHRVPYPIVEHFYTVQGEGAWTGRAAYFIRTAGCDVGCPWCDTKESWEESAHPHLTVGELLAHVREAGAETVVITGGEPTMHDLGPLTRVLQDAGLECHLETSGAYPITGTFDWVTLSPKKYKPPHPSVYPLANDLKIVVVNKSDFRWAEQHAALCPDGTKLWLQPEWGQQRRLPLIIEYVKTHPKWRISLQTHKYLEIP
ncbi:MAG: 7-carboxy-7-deazaguanine synthase QueE [Bacteroidota bacterium]